ncbi:cytochrome c peroxidase [Pontixanthobacter sp. CEM42]|uniref:cytochrome-c peroxidase n=1 Tax=Pontixanthobacter sp. CEM42 TaxID=2792077 RepID=UPI001ADFDC8B|nr:cytochrome c peroxidase [Pontixanthobacter sp. CEM42]
MRKLTAQSGGSLALAIALATLVASCGGDSSTTNNGTGVTVTPTPTPTPTPTDSVAAANAVVQQFLQIDLASLQNYANPTLPVYYDNTVQQIDNTPANDPVNDAIATLGRVLFYDTALSVNDTTSCATCHQQAVGFDDDERFSEGFNGGQFTDAHAMRLGNIRYYEPGDMFWDRRADSVEDQATQPILNVVEMGWDNNGGLPALITKMDALEYYPVLFEFAFGDSTITMPRLERALAQFQRSMISSDSRWDRAYAQVFGAGAPNRALDEALPGFSASEQRGRQLFMNNPGNGGGAGCARCHVPPTYALTANSRSNGLDAGETTIFKSPSLKNVGKSGFFMHDGRFTTLLQVVEHYDSGVAAGPALDNRLTQGGNAPRRLNLSAADRQALVDFMLTLDDETLETDARFTDPFIR